MRTTIGLSDLEEIGMIMAYDDETEKNAPSEENSGIAWETYGEPSVFCAASDVSEICCSS